MPNGVTKKTFETLDTDSKLNILYDQQSDIVDVLKELKNQDKNITSHCSEQWVGCDTRFKKIENNGYKLVGGVLFLAFIIPIISNIVIYLII